MDTTSMDLRNQVALGGAGFSLPVANGSIGVPTVDDERGAIEVIRVAYEAGVRIFDSARAYAPIGDPFHNERLFATALEGRPDVVIATKGGHWRTGPWDFPVDNSPERLRLDVDGSLLALGLEQLPVFYVHRVDLSDFPIAESVGALDELRRAGKIRGIGISNVTAEQVKQAAESADIAAVQNRLSVRTARDADVLAECERRGIAVFGYSTLRAPTDQSLDEAMPRLADLATRRGIPLTRLCLRGLIASSPVVSVIVGAGRPATAREAGAVTDEHWDEDLRAAFTADRAANSDPAPLSR